MEKYYPYIWQLVHKLHLECILDQDKGTKEAVEILYRCQDKKKIWKEIWCQRIMRSGYPIPTLSSNLFVSQRARSGYR